MIGYHQSPVTNWSWVNYHGSQVIAHHPARNEQELGGITCEEPPNLLWEKKSLRIIGMKAIGMKAAPISKHSIGLYVARVTALGLGRFKFCTIWGVDDCIGHKHVESKRPFQTIWCWWCPHWFYSPRLFSTGMPILDSQPSKSYQQTDLVELI